MAVNAPVTREPWPASVARGLSLAAAPTFAVMAVLTLLPGGMPDPLCAAGQEASPLSGMTAMYLLMSAFHAAPWLKLVCGRQGNARRSWLRLPDDVGKPSRSVLTRSQDSEMETRDA